MLSPIEIPKKIMDTRHEITGIPTIMNGRSLKPMYGLYLFRKFFMHYQNHTW
jgi:hypothetical protein